MSHLRFFIVGAPKCGTTSMARWLGEHESVYMSPIKEPHFYCTDLSNRTITTDKAYRQLFKGVNEKHLAVGEASTWYLYSKQAIPQIESEHAEAHYIVLVRDPVEMAHSLYLHNLRVLHEDQPTFDEAWHMQSMRAKGESIPGSCSEPSFLQYKEACSLGTMLGHLFEIVPRERVLILSLDDLKTNPKKEYQRVLSFLKVPDDNRMEFPVENTARGYNSFLLQRAIRYGAKLRKSLGIHRGFGLAKFNDRAIERTGISRILKKELEEAFEHEREKLRRLLDEATYL